MCVFRRVGPRIGPTMHVVYPLGRGVGGRRGGNGSPAPGRAQSAIAARPRRASEPSATPLLTPTFNPRERDIYIRYVPFLILDAKKKTKKITNFRSIDANNDARYAAVRSTRRRRSK